MASQRRAARPALRSRGRPPPGASCRPCCRWAACTWPPARSRSCGGWRCARPCCRRCARRALGGLCYTALHCTAWLFAARMALALWLSGMLRGGGWWLVEVAVVWVLIHGVNHACMVEAKSKMQRADHVGHEYGRGAGGRPYGRRGQRGKDATWRPAGSTPPPPHACVQHAAARDGQGRGGGTTPGPSSRAAQWCGGRSLAWRDDMPAGRPPPSTPPSRHCPCSCSCPCPALHPRHPPRWSCSSCRTCWRSCRTWPTWSSSAAASP